MPLAAPDIKGQILAALAAIFAYELQQQLPGDPLALRTLKQSDLQDDPTRVAPYLVFRDDPERGKERIRGEDERVYGCTEIGGPIRFLYYFNCKFGTLVQTTRDAARHDIDVLSSRIEQTLEKYFDLAGVLAPGHLASTDNSQLIEGANELLIDKQTDRIYGGGQTFYGEGHIYWHYPVSVFRPARVYTGP